MGMAARGCVGRSSECWVILLTPRPILAINDGTILGQSLTFSVVILLGGNVEGRFRVARDSSPFSSSPGQLETS